MLERMSSREFGEWQAFNRVRAAEYEQDAQRGRQEANVRKH